MNIRKGKIRTLKNKLEVGMYCYNKTNRKMGIGKIISFQSNNNVNVRYKNDIELVSIGNLEASYNIIDILEVGDIIKFDITDTDNYAEIQGYNCWEISCEEELNGVKEMILMESAKLISIITREQTESMQYEVD